MLAIFKKIIATLLTFEARLVLKKYKPSVIAVTGSVGKTSTKEAIYQALKDIYSVRRNQKSFNSEIGLPLTVLGLDNAWRHPLRWLENLLHGLSLILRRSSYPKWLVVEVGVDRPGDMRQVARWLKTKIVIITSLPETPVHVEFFPSVESLIEEKALLLETLEPGGTVIWNHDDIMVRELREKKKLTLATKKIKSISYGFDQGADLHASSYHPIYKEINGVKTPVGVSFKIDYRGHSLPVRIGGIIAKHQVYSTLAALAVGLSCDLNLLDLVGALAHYDPPPGRLRPIEGINKSLIIDDTYNSSPVALEAALNTLASLETGGRKVAVLGDMLELGPYTTEAHRNAGKQAAVFSDLLITVGPRAKFITAEAEKKRLGKRKMQHFENSILAAEELPALVKPGDLILVKGSQGSRMEKIVLALMAHPEQRGELLARQEPEWQKR